MQPLFQPSIHRMSIILVVLFTSLLITTSCAFDLANIKPEPSELSPCSKDCGSITIAQEVALVNIACGYDRTIKQGSNWTLVGSIPEGEVFKPVNTCFTIECSNVFEAYLVLRNKTIVGFYLPVEGGFVPLRTPTQLESS